MQKVQRKDHTTYLTETWMHSPNSLMAHILARMPSEAAPVPANRLAAKGNPVIRLSWARGTKGEISVRIRYKAPVRPIAMALTTRAKTTAINVNTKG